jgi:hypothetical protein
MPLMKAVSVGVRASPASVQFVPRTEGVLLRGLAVGQSPAPHEPQS